MLAKVCSERVTIFRSPAKTKFRYCLCTELNLQRQSGRLTIKKSMVLCAVILDYYRDARIIIKVIRKIARCSIIVLLDGLAFCGRRTRRNNMGV